MAASQDAAAAAPVTSTSSTAPTTAVASNPANDEFHLSPAASTIKSKSRSNSNANTNNANNDKKTESTGASAGGDASPDKRDHRQVDGANDAAARPAHKKASKSRRKAKVVKATPPTAVSDSSDSDSDDSEDESSVIVSDFDGDSDSDEHNVNKSSRAKRSSKGKKEKKHKKQQLDKKLDKKARKKSNGLSKQAKSHPSRSKTANADVDWETDHLSESSTSASTSSDSASSSTSSAGQMDKKKRKKSGKRARRANELDPATLDNANAQIKDLAAQVKQLTQLFLSAQHAQAAAQPPSFGLGGQPQTSYQLPHSTVFPGTTSSYTSPPFAETNIVETPHDSLRNLRQVRGRRGKGMRDLLTQPPPERILDADMPVSDSFASEKDLRRNKKKKKGTRADYKRVDWVWDSALYTWKLQDSTESTNDSQYEEYIFHVRRSFDIEGKYRATTVDIKSKLLRECLQDVIGDVKGVSLVDESPKTDPNMLFLYLEDLRDHRKKLKKVKPAGDTKKERTKNQRRLDNKRKQLKVLIGYLDKDYSRTKESLYPMLENGLITFELMWALWKPGTLAYTTTYGSADDPRVFRVELAERHKSFMKGELYHLDGKYFEFDGKKFGQGAVSDEILAFRGARKITSLPCYPLEYHPDERKLRERLIERGKKFVTLSGVHYKSYSGMAYQKSKKCVIKFNIQQSRVMVDPAIFRRINPNYYISPVKTQEESIMFGSGLSDGDDDSEEPYDTDSSNAGHVRMTKALRARKLAAALLGANSNGTGSDMSLQQIYPASPATGLVNGDSAYEAKVSDDDKTPPTFSDDEYLIASPVVLGFAFSEKQWLEFAVDNIKEIVWNDTAWDSLVSERETKDLVQALVKSRKYHAANTIDDVIQGKGKGLVTVLHGPPGTGKTLTAEGISELLKCPLYMASAGELGTDSRFLEAELQKILDICHAWGAILLLDEADVFLEKRNMLDIHRNALVSIFLRQLEYFQGILFLTTNRVETFDEAFQSRIHIALRYGALEPKAKKAIFKMFIERVRSFGKMEVAEFSEENLDDLSRKELNGREIKNVVSSAQDLAVNKEEALSMAHIKQVLDVHARFGRDLKGGPGYDDAMRSYF